MNLTVIVTALVVGLVSESVVGFDHNQRRSYGQHHSRSFTEDQGTYIEYKSLDVSQCYVISMTYLAAKLNKGEPVLELKIIYHFCLF